MVGYNTNALGAPAVAQKSLFRSPFKKAALSSFGLRNYLCQKKHGLTIGSLPNLLAVQNILE